MTVGILLVFFTINVNGPPKPTGPTVSERIFDSQEQCAEFVNTIAKNNVVDDDYQFQFASMDGLIFKGGCYTEQQFNEKFYIESQ